MNKKDDWESRKNISQETTSSALKDSILTHLKYSRAKTSSTATGLDRYTSVALSIRDRLVDKWIQTQRSYYENDVKRVYYLSMEYLVGRALSNYLINLDYRDQCYEAIRDLGYSLEEIEENDIEAGLGNGGLGRLAACYMDSMATLGLAAYGYGIRYEFGIFYQKIVDGFQVETADNWLRQGSPWEIPRPEYLYPVKFYGKTEHSIDPHGNPVCKWVDTHDDVMAEAYDIPVPGYHNNTVNNLRLWSARSTREFDLQSFNMGDYVQSVSRKQDTETLSKVLYPNDNIIQGKELRLKQEYFFVSASIQDIVRRYKKTHSTFDHFSDKVAIQLNDTHPALAIPELMRILVDEERRPWKEAWDLSVKTFAYTNHTILPEALEKWSVDLLGRILPRHLEIIFEINKRFLNLARQKFPGDDSRLSRLSLIQEEGERSARMANLCIVGSHAVNGVAELHTHLLKTKVFKDFHEMYPDRFQNKTNGITPRLWLKAANPRLAGLITETIGDKWVTDLKELEKLRSKISDSVFRQRWQEIKSLNKKDLANFVHDRLGIHVNLESMFDVQVKRIHEYKRQLLCLLHAITLYNRFKEHPKESDVPRTFILAGKAAPGYVMAKLIIKLITSVGDKINDDPQTRRKLKVIFLPNYCVSLARIIIPAADLSEQISTAGMEASGTGNMKLALNGALTIGTLDGATVEIMEEVGEENIFIFGLKAHEVEKLKRGNYRPEKYYSSNPELKNALDMIRDGYFSPNDLQLFQPVIDSLLKHGDPYLVLADFESYLNSQKRVETLFQKKDEWTQKSIINSASMGKFSSDRSIMEYARDIWNVTPHS